MISAYRATPAFAYPGWRLTVPGGPAGGHYKGFTHTQAAGTDIPPGDSYEQDREDGMSSHDAVHATQRNPRGVYRSSAEVPPRPNASGAAMTYRGFQTKRHAGTSVAPGSFPAPFDETEEDAFLAGIGLALPITAEYPMRSPICPAWGCGGPSSPFFHEGPLPFHEGPIIDVLPAIEHVVPAIPQPGVPKTGATSVVNQPTPTPQPLPPSPAVAVVTAPPISPRPSPVIATNEVVPDRRGNWINVSTGESVPDSAVEQNPVTGQVTSTAGALSWLEQPSSFFPSIPNWGLLIGAGVLATMFMGKRR